MEELDKQVDSDNKRIFRSVKELIRIVRFGHGI